MFAVSTTKNVVPSFDIPRSGLAVGSRTSRSPDSGFLSSLSPTSISHVDPPQPLEREQSRWTGVNVVLTFPLPGIWRRVLGRPVERSQRSTVPAESTEMVTPSSACRAVYVMLARGGPVDFVFLNIGSAGSPSTCWNLIILSPCSETRENGYTRKKMLLRWGMELLMRRGVAIVTQNELFAIRGGGDVMAGGCGPSFAAVDISLLNETTTCGHEASRNCRKEAERSYSAGRCQSVGEPSRAPAPALGRTLVNRWVERLSNAIGIPQPIDRQGATGSQFLLCNRTTARGSFLPRRVVLQLHHLFLRRVRYAPHWTQRPS